jgi:CRP-like cAMP-binding protein
MELKTIKTNLGDSELFRGLEENELDILLHNAHMKEFPPGKILYMKGEKSNDTFCMIVTGSVDIVAPGGNILKTMGPGEVVGEVALSDPNQIRTVNVITKEPSEVLEWNVKHIRDKIPVIWKKLLKLAWKNISNYYEE